MRKLTQLRIDEVSSVDKGAGEGVKVMLYKRDTPQGPLLFNDIMLRKATEPTDTGDEPSTANLSATLDELTAEIVASSTPHHINPLRARRWLLTTPQGQQLLLQRATKKRETPMLDFAKLLEITEHGLNAQVTQQTGESFAKAFTRKYESDESYRRQWQNHQDTKMMLSLSKATSASMTPTTAVVGDTSVADDSAEAVRLLTEMAEQTGQSFEVVFSAPENKELAARTYTMHNRPNNSSTVEANFSVAEDEHDGFRDTKGKAGRGRLFLSLRSARVATDGGGVRAAIVHPFPGGFQSFPSGRGKSGRVPR
jgi:hypothetical protein